MSALIMLKFLNRFALVNVMWNVMELLQIVALVSDIM